MSQTREDSFSKAATQLQGGTPEDEQVRAGESNSRQAAYHFPEGTVSHLGATKAWAPAAQATAMTADFIVVVWWGVEKVVVEG